MRHLRNVISCALAWAVMLALTACSQNTDTVPQQSDTEAKSVEADISDKESSKDALPSGESEDTDVSESTQSTRSGNPRTLIVWFSMPEDVDVSGVDAVAGASIVVKNDQVMGNTEYVAGIVQEVTGADMFRIETVESYPLDHDPLVEQAAEEQDAVFRPQLAAHIENLEQYDTIILGYPNWWGDLPMPVYSFLEEYDLGAKTIIPFVTHGGSSFSGTRSTISQLQPGAFVSDNTLSLSRNDVAGSEAGIRQWAESLGLNREENMPENNSDTVAKAAADPHTQQTLYLWEKDNMPSVTEYTENNGYYADGPDFRPYVVTFPVPEETVVKGAVLICAGGAFQFRSDQNEGTPVALALSNLGYQCFVVNYRLRPYTQQEGALDLARAVRFVRKNAAAYGIREDDIAVMGFSAGGILAGEMLLNFDGTVNGTALDAGYIPDEVDRVSADAAADGMIYSFYGRLSVASTDTEKFAASNLPPTYFCYGIRAPFTGEFEKCIDALKKAGVSVEVDVLQGRPHGYGYTEGWIPAYDRWLETIFGTENETKGTDTYRGFSVDNVLHSQEEGDIHYHVYIPESYDGSRPYALYVTLPGYEGLYFQGVGANLKSEEFGFEAINYNSEMIVVAPQLNDWGETSANQTIALVEYFLEQYNIDREKVYGSGYSGGGETMSLVMGKRPDLFTAYLHVSSQWDGPFEPAAEHHLPVYFAIGENDEYYGSKSSEEAYGRLYDLYEKQGLPKEKINEILVLDIKKHDYFTQRNAVNEHGGGGLFAYDKEIMGWLFSR